MNAPTHDFNIYDHLGLESYRITEGLENTDWAAYARVIEDLLRQYSIHPEQLQEATDTYEDIANYLNEALLTHGIKVSFYPQGSLAQRTTVKSASSNEFDLDLIARKDNGGTIEALELLQLVEDKLRVHDIYGNGLKPKNRCVMLPLPGKPFTVDITPGLPVLKEWDEAEWNTDSEPLLVGDRNDGPHKPSNPKGFTSWLDDRASLVPPQLRVAVLDKSYAMESADAEPIPDQEKSLNDVLRRTIQLLKLHRNAYYRKQDNVDKKRFQPISVLMTTLATRAYETYYNNPALSPIELMLEVIEQMPRFIGRLSGRYTVENPTIKGENFADKWNDRETGRQRVGAFIEWHQQVCLDMRELLTSKNPKVIKEASVRAFGVVGTSLAALLVALLADEVQAVGHPSQSDGGLLRSHLSSKEPSGFNDAPKESNHA